MNARTPHDLAQYVALRHALHRHPETGFDIAATAAVVADWLDEAGLTVRTDIGGGVVATLRHGTGNRAIALRAELDALPITEATNLDHRSQTPGRFHGCGHDGHMTMLIGAALQLARQRDFDGTVHFVFQPDEENGLGAQAMIEAGFFDAFEVDAIYGLHNMPGLALGRFTTAPGVFTAFEDRFEIRIDGRGGHSSAPERAIDPMLPAAELVLAAQSIVGRAISPRDHAVVSITDCATDGAWNVIPSTVTLRGDARGYRDEVSRTIEHRLADLAAGAAQGHGAQATLSYRREFRPCVNAAPETELAARAATGVACARVDGQSAPVGFSEDFAHFLDRVPGCFMLMGNGTEGAHGASLHNPCYDFNDAAIPYGIAYWVALVQAELGG